MTQVNDLSNLLNRTNNGNKYFDGNVPEFNGNENDVDEEYRDEAKHKTIIDF